MPDLTETLRLVEHVSARLCHDLGGLIGTVGGAVDMLAEEDGRDGEIAAFAMTASRALVQRLRLMRAAWGPETEAMTLNMLMALAEPSLTARRVVLDFGSVAASEVFAPRVARIVLNLLLLAADGLPRGGMIKLIGGAADLFVRIEGQGAAWPTGLAACVHDEAAAIAALSTARSVQMPLTALFALGGMSRLSPVIGPLPEGGSGIAALRLTTG